MAGRRLNAKINDSFMASVVAIGVVRRPAVTSIGWPLVRKAGETVFVSIGIRPGGSGRTGALRIWFLIDGNVGNVSAAYT